MTDAINDDAALWNDSANKSFLAKLSSSELSQLVALQLRHRFVDHLWTASLWQSLQKVGVVYRNGPYHFVKGGLIFDSSKELFLFLDEFAIPDIDNRLELDVYSNNNSDMTEERKRIGRELRNSVLLDMFKKSMESLKGIKSPITTRPEFMLEKGRNTKVDNRQRITRKSNNKSVTVVEAGAELLFRNVKRKRKLKGDTTDHMLSPQQVADIFSLQNRGNSYQGTTTDFEEWRFLLSTNHSVMLHGLGSKQELLEKFSQYIQATHCGDVLAIHGYHREVTIEEILDLLVSQFLDGVEPIQVQDVFALRSTGISSPALLGTHPWVRRAMAIGQGLAQRAIKCKRPIFWCLHNIDGAGLQNRTAQQGIAALLVNSRVTKESSGLRLIASMDHVNATAMLWDTQTQANLAICWKQVHTFRPYLEEMKWGMEEENRKATLERLKSANESDENDFTEVLSALSPRHSEVLRVLASLQLESPDTPVHYEAFFLMCKHKCVVASDKDLLSFLTELVDHGIVERGRDGGREMLKIPYSEERLHFILENC